MLLLPHNLHMLRLVITLCFTMVGIREIKGHTNILAKGYMHTWLINRVYYNNPSRATE